MDYVFNLTITADRQLTEHELASIQQTYQARLQGYHAPGKDDTDAKLTVHFTYDRAHSAPYTKNQV